MGKKNKNKNKVREAEATYLVVVNPWGQPGHPNFINNVAAWFEIMLADDFEHMRVDVVYTHKQHQNLILEFSTQFNTSPYLGSHVWEEFLSPPWNQTVRDCVSFVYDYNFAKYLEPGQRGWKTNIPSYDSIPRSFPIQSPYPSSGPAPIPGMEVPYAIPPKNAARELPMPKREQSASLPVKEEKEICGLRREPSAAVEDFLNSIDIDIKPPVKAEPLEQVLRSPPPPSLPPRVKQEPVDSPSVKQERLDSPLRMRVKIEEEDIKPDIATLPHLARSSPTPLPDLPDYEEEDEEAQEEPIENPTGYEPSDELMAAFAGLPDNYLSGLADSSGSHPASPTASQPQVGVRVKNEPIEDTNPFRDFRGRSMTFATEHGTPQPSMNPIRIKSEPRDPSLPLSPPRNRVKAEPEDTFPIPNHNFNQISSMPPARAPSTPSGTVYDRSRDPRLARMKAQGGVKREPEDDERIGRATVKRVKVEPD